MVTTCSVKGCKSKAGQGIKFHRLPKSEIREAWITFLKKCNPLFKPTSRSINLCGLHFSSDLDYEITPTSVYQTKRLKKNAIPSIMNQDIDRPLCNQSNQELNCVPDQDAEEEIVTLSLADVLDKAKLPNCPPPLPLPCTEQYILLPLSAVKNGGTVSPSIVIQNGNEFPNAIVAVQNGSTVSPAPVIQHRNGVPSVSSAPVIQHKNEIPSALVQSPVVDKSLLRPNNKRMCFMGDFKQLSDIDSPDSRLKYWTASQATVSKQKKKIKVLHKQTVELKKKLDHLLNQQKNEKKKDSNNCVTVIKVPNGPDKWLAAVFAFNSSGAYLTHWIISMENK